MTSLSDVLESWSMLEGRKLSSETLLIRELEDVQTPSGPPMIALDAQGRHHLLIPVGRDALVEEDRRSSGVQVVRHELVDFARSAYVDVICLKPHLNELFSVLVSEMLTGLVADASHADRTCVRVLDRWRDLLDREYSSVPSVDTLVGLFAELYHLRQIVRRRPAAADCWMGPRGARHDFSSGSVALEVKGSRVRHGRFFEINGHEQLEAPMGGTLFLAAMKLESTSSGESFAEIVDSIVQLGANRGFLNAMFSAVGVDAQAFDGIAETRFDVRESRIYVVTEEFPRIVADSFVRGSPPPGVLRLNYVIDLTGEPPVPVDDTQVAYLYDRLAGIGTSV